MAGPSKNRPSKGKAPESPADTNVVGNNIDKPGSGEMVPLNFKTDPEFKKAFKTFAVGHDMSMVDLLKESFEFYKQHKGG